MPALVTVAGVDAAPSVAFLHSRLWPARQWTLWHFVSQYAVCRHRMHRECAPFLPHAAHKVMSYSMLLDAMTDRLVNRWLCKCAAGRRGGVPVVCVRVCLGASPLTKSPRRHLALVRAKRRPGSSYLWCKSLSLWRWMFQVTDQFKILKKPHIDLLAETAMAHAVYTPAFSSFATDAEMKCA